MRTSLVLALAVCCVPGTAQPRRHAVIPDANQERRAADAFDRAYAQGQLALTAFVARMPKGADLHTHLVGAVYAETFLKDAAEDRLCLDPATHSLLKSTGQWSEPPVCRKEPCQQPRSSAIAISTTP